MSSSNAVIICSLCQEHPQQLMGRSSQADYIAALQSHHAVSAWRLQLENVMSWFISLYLFGLIDVIAMISHNIP